MIFFCACIFGPAFPHYYIVNSRLCWNSFHQKTSTSIYYSPGFSIKTKKKNLYRTSQFGDRHQRKDPRWAMMAPFKMLCVITGLAIGTNVVVKCLSAKQYRERLITVSEISKLEKLIDGQVSQLGVRTADIAAANHGAVPLYHSTWQTLCFIHKCWGSVITLLDLTDRVKKSNVHYSKELQSDPTNQCIREQCESLDTSLSLLHQRSHSISSAFMALVAEAIGKRWSRLPPEATTQQRLLDASMDSIQEIVSEIGDWNSINDELG